MNCGSMVTLLENLRCSPTLFSGGVRQFSVDSHTLEPKEQGNLLKALPGGTLCPNAFRRGFEYGRGGCLSTVLLLT